MPEFFWKIHKLLKHAVLNSSSKFIMTVQVLNNEKSKITLCICDGFLKRRRSGASKIS